MKRALVIDDDEKIISLLIIMLEEEKILVESASNGDDGIKKYNDGNFDLVITDLSMPKCTGNDVCKHIRNSNRPHTPVICITGTPWGLPENHFDLVIQKPFSIETLLDQVHRLCQKEAEQNNSSVYSK